MDVVHPRYPVLPKLGMSVAPALLALASVRPIQKLKPGTYDAVVMGVAHDEFRKMGLARIRELARKNHVLYDIKYVFRTDEVDGRL